MAEQTKAILIIEDEIAMLRILTDKFSQEGFRVIKAANGEEGLRFALSERPDLILLDIVMPRMGGLEMLDKLREDEWGKTAKVILLTNLSDIEKISEAVKEGAYDYLIKSDWKLKDIVKKVKEKLGV